MYHPDAAEWQDWYAYCPDQPSLEQHESFELFEVPAWSFSLVAASDPEAPATIYVLRVNDGNAYIWVVFPRTGKMSKICPIFFSLELYCDQTVLFFQVFSIVLKRLCPLQSKNTFVLVPAIFFRFLKNLCFWPKISFFGNLWRSRATKPSELDWIWPVHNFGG